MDCRRQLQNILNSFTDIQAEQSYRHMIIDFSKLDMHKEIFKKYSRNNSDRMLTERLVRQEKEHYEQKKEYFDLEAENISTNICNLFFLNLQLKDYVQGFVCQPELYHSLARCSSNKDENYLQFLQRNQTTLRRGAAVQSNGNLQQITQEIKAKGTAGRPGVQFLLFSCEINLEIFLASIEQSSGSTAFTKSKLDSSNNPETQEANAAFQKAARFAKESQGIGQLPIVDVRFVTGNLTRPQILAAAQLAFSQFNWWLMEESVESELMILAINLADIYFKAKMNSSSTKIKLTCDITPDEHAFRIVYTLFNSLPPAIGGIYFSFNSTFYTSGGMLDFLNQLRNFGCYSCWPYGILIQPDSLDEIVKSYAIIQREQSAIITINQSLKVFQDALSGKYKSKQEFTELKPIELGSLV